jgi:hypothetical protein
MTFLYLIPNGLNAPEHPTWGGWAGRYGPNEKTLGKPYYHANVLDDWRGTKSRDNSLARWAVALQNDFRARLDWCVQPVSRANHPPIVFVEGARNRTVGPGRSVTFDAAATRDPDQDEINYEWFFYPEAGTYPGPTPAIADPNSARPRLEIPADAGGCSLHLILAVTDRGAPPLTRYARIVLDVRKD